MMTSKAAEAAEAAEAAAVLQILHFPPDASLLEADGFYYFGLEKKRSSRKTYLLIICISILL